jgi:membrane-bound lytic murein transglycosylase D
MRSNLLVLLCLLLGTPAPVGAETPRFARPDSLEPRVAFWTRIYSEVGSDGGLIHDSAHLGVVYEVVRLPGLSDRSRERKIEQMKKDTVSSLKRLAGGKRTGLSDHEQRVLSAWPKDVSNQTLSAAARRVRFQRGQADKFRAGIARAGAWEPYIRGVLDEHGVPIELAALPHVESSFNPNAYSHAGASGIWQFTRSTGRRFMRVDWVLDERRDPLLATVAAARLLRENFETTQTWPLAITAYNHGAAGMNRAVRKLGTRDIGVIVERYESRSFGFASRNFYTEFLAALDVSRNAERYFGPIQQHPPFDPEIVVLEAHYSAKTLADAFGLSQDDLRRFNLALLSPVWDGSKHVPARYGLRVPRSSHRPAAGVVLASVPDSQRYAKQKGDRLHRVRPGDTVSRIASRYGVKQGDIVALNGLHSRHRIRVGQMLRLPTHDAPVAASSSSVARQERPSDGVYKVQRGDSISRIARRFGVSERDLLAANHLKNRNLISPGQMLQIPGGNSEPTTETAELARYEVRSGDTLARIAKRHGVSVNEIVAVNHLRNRNRLRVGQTLRLPQHARVAETPTEPPAAQKVETPKKKEVASKETAAKPDAVPKPEAAPVKEEAPKKIAAASDEPSPAAAGPRTRRPPAPDSARLAVSDAGAIRVEPEETLGHYADWLSIPTQRLRVLNGLRFDEAISLGRSVKLDFDRVSKPQFEKRRVAFHRELQDRFFAKHQVTGTKDYVLEAGDTLWVLSHRKLSVPVWLLTAYNPNVDFGAPLRPGVRIRVPRIESREA